MISLEKEWKQQQRSYHDVCLEFSERKEKRNIKGTPFFFEMFKTFFSAEHIFQENFSQKNTSVDNWMNINLEIRDDSEVQTYCDNMLVQV